VFISADEINQLIDLAFPERVFPILLNQAAKILNKSSYLVKSISESNEFVSLLRRSLFLGLSDGARLDVLRRRALLNNEQVSVNYELSDEKCSALKKDLTQWLATKNDNAQAKFVNLFLVDDFSGSGTSILRFDGEALKGKLPKIKQLCESETSLGGIVSVDVQIFLLLYMQTSKSIEHLSSSFKKLNDDFFRKITIVDPLQLLNKDYKRLMEDVPGFAEIVRKYYDVRARDSNTDVGGTKDVRYGYAACSLPMVIEHNTPNNSIALLWANVEPDQQTLTQHPGMKALFPRISRHREDKP
jgi:hypothetical protein